MQALLYPSDKGFGGAIEINATPEGTRLWKRRIRKRVGYAEAMESESSLRYLFFLFVSMGVCGTYVKEKGTVSQLVEEYEEDSAGLYILLSLLLVS